MEPIHVALLTTTGEFASLEGEWAACLERSEDVSIFMTWEWLECWWRHYGSGRPLRLFVARRGSRVVGILPVYVRREATVPGFSCRVLRFVGTGADTSPDYLGPVVDAEGAAETRAALCRAVCQDPSWDALRLTELPEGSAFAEAMRVECSTRGVRLRRAPTGHIPIVPLPSTWEEYLDTFQRNQRSNIRRQRRKLEGPHRARLFTWDDGATLDSAIERLGELHRQRWSGRADRHAFSSEEYVSFHRQVMHACHRRGWLRLHCLELDGRLAAVNYCYAYRGEVSLFQGGFDTEHAQLRLGYVLLGWSIEQAIREGARIFDLLKGEYAYKNTWARDRRAMCELRGYRRTPAGLLLNLRREYLAPWRRRARAALSPRPAVPAAP